MRPSRHDTNNRRLSNDLRSEETERGPRDGGADNPATGFEVRDA